MKKFLITGVCCLFVLPVMALDLNYLIEPDDTGSCSGTEYQDESVTMQAVYVTDSCDAGYYFKVGANAEIDTTSGVVTDISCEPCSDGHYCPNTTNVTLNDGILSNQGEYECAAGTYGNATERGEIPSNTEDPDYETNYETIISNYKVCQSCPVGTYASTTGASECTTCADGYYASGLGNSICTAAQAGYYALANHSGEEACTGATYASGTGNTSCSNVKTGYYALADHSDEEKCPTGYDKIAAASKDDCKKVIECPSDCSNLRYTSSCSIDDTRDGENVTFANRTADGSCFETIARNAETGKLECAPGYTEENMYAWMADHMDSVSSNITYCSPDGQTNGVAPFEDCENVEPGTTIYTFRSGYSAPANSVHNATVCSDYLPATFDANNFDTYVISATEAQANGFNGQSTGRFCWSHNIDMPNQPWFLAHDYTYASGCAETCGGFVVPQSGSDYMYGSKQGENFVLSQNGRIAAYSYGVLASMTDGQNGNPSADVCVPSKVNIDWKGTSLANDDPARTCTYGENDLTAPSEEQLTAPLPGYKFIGWTVR